MNEISKSEVGDWWTNNPMNYSSGFHGGTLIGGKNLEPGTKEFFEGVDREFLSPRPTLRLR